MGSSLCQLQRSEISRILFHVSSFFFVYGSHLMQIFSQLQQSSEIIQLLKVATTIAIVGLSPKENRPSNMVGRYLISTGYTVYPINPGQNEILGLKCYPNLDALPFPADIINIFRRSEEVMKIVEEVLALKNLPKALWMQQGIRNETAAGLAKKQGIFVVMDRCIKIDHENLIRR